MISGFVIQSTQRTITDEGLRSIRSNSINGRSILVSCIGDIGRVAITESTCATNQQINAITDINDDLYDAWYVYYKVSTLKSRFLSCAGCTVVPILAKSAFEEVEISDIPPLDEQKKISSVLSTIDRKIALNRKRIATLEAMAKEIYDYWFVQFDFPDAHGRPYKSSGGAMVYNPDLKREIPKGWEVGCLADIALYPKETVRSDAIDINHYVTTDSLLQGKKGRAQAENLPPVPVSLVAFQKADTLVANIRPYLKKLWYASESGGCSQDVLVFRPICSELAPLVHSILWQDAFFDYVMAAAKGSKMPRGDKAHILAYPISLPDNKVARRFGETVEKFYAWRECALKESELLSSLRDFLLPLLMNGQVKVA